MRKFALLPFLLGFLFVASAGAAVPSFNTTTEYQALKSYVAELQGLQTTPVSETQKNTYTANLTVKVNNANTKVAKLNTQRISQAKNDYSKQKQKILKSAKASAKKQKKKALATYKRYSAEEKAAYQAELARIAATYNDDINRTNRLIRKLKRQLNKTNDPLKVDQLESRINQLENKILTYQNEMAREKSAAKISYNKALSDERAAYKRRLDRISERFQDNLNDRNAQAKRTYNSRLAKIADINSNEKDTVSNLSTQGQLYISNMPPLLTK